MAENKKLTTAEILAMARQKAAGGSVNAGDKEPPVEASAPTPGAADSPTGIAPAESGSAPSAPKSTADILAAARAGAGGAVKAAAKPASTADILAAARGGGAAKPATQESKSATALAKKPVAAAASSEQPNIQEMVAAVKQAQSGSPVLKLPPKLAPAQPKLPPKKAVGRRRFVELLSAITVTPFAVAWGAMTGIGGLWSLGIASFMMPNMVLELPSQFKVGPPSDFPPGTVSEKFKASRGIWIVRTAQYDGRDLIYALTSVCTHLGCTPNWLEGEQKFKCPCHGSGFYITGINFEGPAPRPLERAGLRLSEDGMLEVDKSLKFQEELGQWGDGKSFFAVT